MDGYSVHIHAGIKIDTANDTHKLIKFVILVIIAIKSLSL